MNYLTKSYNSLKMNNLCDIIVTKDIYFIYIEEKVSKKFINTKVVTCS